MGRVIFDHDEGFFKRSMRSKALDIVAGQEVW